MQSDYIKHHGIRGQKWGVRRFQRTDGTLTPEGRRHKEKLESTKSEYKKLKSKSTANKIAGIYDSKTEYALEKTRNELYFRKKQVANDKARSEIANRENVGKREQALIDKYQKSGMSKEDAELKAYNQIKLEKTLAIAGAVTMAAATAYGLKKYHDYTTDAVLKAGKVQMKRVAASDSKDLHDTFYAAFGKGDANKYVGMYGSHLKTSGAENIYQKTIDIKSDLKIASDKRAKDTMASVLRSASKESKDETIGLLKKEREAFAALGGVKQSVVISKAINDIEKGKYDTKAVYDSMNMAFGQNTKIIRDFKETLKKSGYSGVNDRNDKAYSGYDANTARIIFDTSKVRVSDVRKVSDAEVYGKGFLESHKSLLKRTLPAIAVIAGASEIGKKVKSKDANNRIINNYKKQHPNSDLTDEQILENHYGGK